MTPEEQDKERAIERSMARRRAYWGTFLGSDQKPHANAAIVLASLRKFCGVDKPGIVVSPVQRMTDPYATAYLAGQRDVYNHILTMLEPLKETTDGRREPEPKPE